MDRLLALALAGVALLGAATPAFGQMIRWAPPVAFVYHGPLGGNANYIVIWYEVSNPSNAMAFNSWGIMLQGPNGKQFEDGFHPMVQAAFCHDVPGHCPGGTTELRDTVSVHRDLLPGSKIDALAIFEVYGPFPDTLTMAFKTAEGLQQHRVSYKLAGSEYSEVKTESKKTERRK
jgi:hypothetical protein